MSEITDRLIHVAITHTSQMQLENTMYALREHITKLETTLQGTVALVRIGFLVTVDGERIKPDLVRNPETRALLMTILQAEDTDAAIATLKGETAI